jgi:hypothetical protein
MDCAVYETHKWEMLTQPTSVTFFRTAAAIWRAECRNCGFFSYWRQSPAIASDGLLIYPSHNPEVAAPHPDMPQDVREIYEEAAAVVGRSPRAAGALMRYAVQVLMPHLDASGGDLNAQIGSLVAKGLDVGIQQALDALRVIGNNAVHPLEIDVNEDPSTVQALFGLLNVIVEALITQPKSLNAVYAKLPAGARAQIERRDKGASGQPT